jgi:hypothetical protein
MGEQVESNSNSFSFIATKTIQTVWQGTLNYTVRRYQTGAPVVISFSACRSGSRNKMGCWWGTVQNLVMNLSTSLRWRRANPDSEF